MSEYGPGEAQCVRRFATVSTRTPSPRRPCRRVTRAFATDRRRPAFDMLVDLGLLMRDAAADQYLAVDPASLQSRVVTRWAPAAPICSPSRRSGRRAFGSLGPDLAPLPSCHPVSLAELHGLDTISASSPRSWPTRSPS